MSKISELIDEIKIYNICNHCDHYDTTKICRIGDEGCNCKEEIERQIIAEIRAEAYQQGRADAIDEFLKKDKECQQKHEECPYMYSEIDCVECIAEQLKEQKNN